MDCTAETLPGISLKQIDNWITLILDDYILIIAIITWSYISYVTCILGYILFYIILVKTQSHFAYRFYLFDSFVSWSRM